MNVFIAGGHGVGKTFLVARTKLPAAVLATSASKLIKEERGQANWGVDKRVGQLYENQIALAAAVRRHNDAGTRLMLDGHFVLRGAAGELMPLDAAVFASLKLTGVVLLEAAPALVAERIRGRDGHVVDEADISALAAAERAQAHAVCAELGLKLVTLEDASEEAFSAAVGDFLKDGV